MKLSAIGNKVKRSLLIQIGLTWIALLLVPAAMQVMNGNEITTIGNASHSLAGTN